MVHKILKLRFIFPTLSNEKYSPVDRGYPAEEDICREQLQKSHQELGLAPGFAETTADHSAKSYFMVTCETNLPGKTTLKTKQMYYTGDFNLGTSVSMNHIRRSLSSMVMIFCCMNFFACSFCSSYWAVRFASLR